MGHPGARQVGQPGDFPQRALPRGLRRPHALLPPTRPPPSLVGRLRGPAGAAALHFVHLRLALEPTSQALLGASGGAAGRTVPGSTKALSPVALFGVRNAAPNAPSPGRSLRRTQCCPQRALPRRSLRRTQCCPQRALPRSIFAAYPMLPPTRPPPSLVGRLRGPAGAAALHFVHLRLALEPTSQALLGVSGGAVGRTVFSSPIAPFPVALCGVRTAAPNAPSPVACRSGSWARRELCRLRLPGCPPVSPVAARFRALPIGFKRPCGVGRAATLEVWSDRRAEPQPTPTSTPSVPRARGRRRPALVGISLGQRGARWHRDRIERRVQHAGRDRGDGCGDGPG